MKENIKALFDKIRNKQALFVILIIGMILMLAAESFSGDGNDTVQDKGYIDSDRYCESLEEKLTAILSEMKGVGRVHVMITLENRNAVDISVKDRSGEAVLKRAGSTEEPVITKERYPVIKGVVIAAQGASSEAVCEEIYYAAKAALDVGGSKIAVVEAK